MRTPLSIIRPFPASIAATWRRLPAIAHAAIALLVCAAAAALEQRLFPHAGGLAFAAAPLLLGDIKQFGKTYAMLREITRPNQADQPESQPWVLFDTQPYAAAGSASLTFFKSATAANASDPTLSNFATGQLDAGYFFEMHRLFVYIHAVPAAVATVAITGPAQDVQILHKTARGNLSWNYKGRPYGGFPLAFFGRPGGPMSTYAPYGTGTVANNIVSTGETENNGGFPVQGNLIIAPATQFTSTMTFISTAISAQTNITIAMMGVLHRPL
jgi:hypothetical protein